MDHSPLLRSGRLIEWEEEEERTPRKEEEEENMDLQFSPPPSLSCHGLALFIGSALAGAIFSVINKALMATEGEGLSQGTAGGGGGARTPPRPFTKPLTITFLVSLGCSFLIFVWLIQCCILHILGSSRGDANDKDSIDLQPQQQREEEEEKEGEEGCLTEVRDMEEGCDGRQDRRKRRNTHPTPSWNAIILAASLATLCDLIDTVVSFASMMFIPASVNSLIGGTKCIWVYLLKYFVIKQNFSAVRLAGIGLVFLGTIFIAFAAILGGDGLGTHSHRDLLIGVLLSVLTTVLAAVSTTTQEVILQHKLGLMMEQTDTTETSRNEDVSEEEDIPLLSNPPSPSPPPITIDPTLYQGLTSLVSLLVLGLMMTIDPCTLHIDSFSSAQCLTGWTDTWVMIESNRSLAALVLGVIISSTIWSLSATWVNARLDALYNCFIFLFRGVLTWVIGLGVHFVLPESRYGEKWNTYSPLMLIGILLLSLGLFGYGSEKHAIRSLRKLELIVFGEKKER